MPSLFAGKSLPRTLAALQRYPESWIIVEFEDGNVVLAAHTQEAQKRMELPPTTLEAYSYDALDIILEKLICQVVKDSINNYKEAQ